MAKHKDAAGARARAEEYRRQFIGNPSSRNENVRHARQEGDPHSQREKNGPIRNRKRGRRSTGRVPDSRRG